MTGKLTKSQSKYIKSLQQKKVRDLNKQFVVEGVKLVRDLLNHSGIVDYLVYTGDNEDYAFAFPERAFHTSPKELAMISSLKTPNKILAVCNQGLPFDSKRARVFGQLDFSKSIIALDEISDPGNLGTILRLADWFGIKQIVCAPGSVDVFNPKVVQATMGAIFRVNVQTMPLVDLIDSAPSEMKAYLADMEGENLYTAEVSSPFILVMGSEGHGVSAEIRKLVPSVISIPQFGGGESLNVAVSTGIILSEFCRKLG
ncbi:RNA methyltransferase [Cryomorpha ignava]|uniref:RNA methyltransferase n=1 Tax=Cryomorpha ignava TaxID=101383 RepID=A0A7K3WRL6_9FLAO|nr:RNA methyltransferase [Cryomorpha ignava]NEN23355.1 RNA methyltransferase [Cryomorpha ignava]